jgi:lysine-specific demethylase 8
MAAQPHTLNRIDRPTPQHFHHEYIAPARPAVLTGIANQWPSHGRWSAEYFRRQYGAIKARIELQGGKDPRHYFPERKYAEMDLATFVDKLPEEHPRHYLSQWPALRNIPELTGDLVPLSDYQTVPEYYPDFLRRRLRLERHFWFGAAGTFSTLHFDPADNFFAQIWGRKKFILFAPEQGPLLYRSHQLCEQSPFCLGLFSPVDVAHPDLERFPRYAQATPIEVVLEPGEILYVPPGWWHYVVSVDASMGVSHWWYRQAIPPHNVERYVSGAACWSRLALRGRKKPPSQKA